MNVNQLLMEAIQHKSLTVEEGTFLYKKASTAELLFTANELRKINSPENQVGWIIDRNVNITNGCICCCKFCNFHRIPGKKDVYVTSLEQYKQKIDELIRFGGDQLLLQGGLHPTLGLKFYADLFCELKKIHPPIKLHALGPPEIAHIAKLENQSYSFVLETLADAGLDSLPGAGAEILSDRVRKIVSPAKCSVKEWLDVMRIAHKMGMVTSATMMFGHVETKEERIQHLVHIRDVQNEKPDGATGFIAFIPWPFQDTDTLLQKNLAVHNTVTSEDYIRTIAISRIMLPNIKNIQASWLTVGKQVAQVCLQAGANDFGSIMIEENVVSSAGAFHSMDVQGICDSIREAGFVPRRRNQNYVFLD